MTSIQDSDFRPVRSEADVRDLSKGNGKSRREQKLGVEEEIFSFDAATLAPANAEQNIAQFEALRNIKPSHEPCNAQLEHISDAYTYGEMHKVLDQMMHQRAVINAANEKIGLVRGPFSSIPHITGAEAFSNMIQATDKDHKRGERQRLLMSIFPKAVKGSPDYPVLNTALHYTTGMSNMDEDLEKGRRIQFLMPFLLILNENRSPFNAAHERRQKLGEIFSQSIDSRKGLGERGCVDVNYFIANNGEELASLKFQDTIRNQMMAYYGLALDTNGITVPEFRVRDADKETLVQFKSFIEQDSGLGHRTNFYMARSQRWNWLKTKNLFDQDGNASDLLQERRDFDPGIHQIHTMTLILAAIDFNDDVASAVDDLLADFGFDADKWGDNGLSLVQKSLESAYFRGNENYHNSDQYMDITFGNGRMRDFSKKFSEIMEEHYKNTQYSRYLEPMRYIIETGRTDAQVARDLIRSPEDNLPFMRSFDPKWFENPMTCLGMLEESGAFREYQKTPDTPQNVANDVLQFPNMRDSAAGPG